jgi:hypothetical protein
VNGAACRIDDDHRPVHSCDDRDELLSAIRIASCLGGEAARVIRQPISGCRSAPRFDRLVAVAALFGQVDVTAEGYAVVEAIADGWWYSAPVVPGHMIAMLMTTATSADVPRWLLPNVGASCWHRPRETAVHASGVMIWGPRVFSAASQRLRRTEHDAPWIAVGDACLAVDPISGSGVVRALRSAQAATRTTLALLEADPSQVIPAYESDGDIECSRYLQERALYYAVERRWEGSPFWSRRLRATTDSRAPAGAGAPTAEA